MKIEPTTLFGIRCRKCKKLFVPPKYACPECGNVDFESVNLSGKGRIQSFTTIRVPPTGFEDQAPYDVAVIRLDEKIHMTTRLIRDKEREVKIGDLVSFVGKDEIGGYWFKQV